MVIKQIRKIGLTYILANIEMCNIGLIFWLIKRSGTSLFID